MPFVGSDFGHMLSVDAICFEDGFCTSKKGAIGRGGRVSAQGALHMAAGCITALVGTGWTILTLLAQIGAETTPLPW